MTHFQTQMAISMDTLLPCGNDELLKRAPRSLAEASAALGTNVLRFFDRQEARKFVLTCLHTSVEKVYRADSFGEIPFNYTMGDVIALRLLAAVYEYNATIDNALADDTLYGAAFARVERNAKAKLRRVEMKYVGQAINLKDYI